MFQNTWRHIVSGAALFLIALSVSAHADEALTARNKAVVRDFYTNVFLARNVDAAPRYVAPSYLQHNPQVPTGLKGLMDTFRPVFASYPPDFKREILAIVAENDIVVLYHRKSWTSPKDHQHHVALGFDMFRVQNGMITEHWDADS